MISGTEYSFVPQEGAIGWESFQDLERNKREGGGKVNPRQVPVDLTIPRVVENELSEELEESEPKDIRSMRRLRPFLPFLYLYFPRACRSSTMSLPFATEKQVAVAAVRRACALTSSVFNRLVKNEMLDKNDKSPVTGMFHMFTIVFFVTWR